MTIIGANGFSLSGDTIGPGNWNEDASEQRYAAYLYTSWVRGPISVSGMDVSTPPLGLCSPSGQSSGNPLYGLLCPSGSAPHEQTYEAFFRFTNLNVPSYRGDGW